MYGFDLCQLKSAGWITNLSGIIWGHFAHVAVKSDTYHMKSKFASQSKRRGLFPFDRLHKIWIDIRGAEGNG